MIASKPLSATISIILCVTGVVFNLIFVFIGAVIILPTYRALASIIIELFYYIIVNIIILFGAYYINRRRYKFGGAISFITSCIVMLFTLPGLDMDFLALIILSLPIIGGLLGMLTKEDLSSAIFKIVKLYGRLRLSDLATRLNKTEAEVEFGIIEMQSKGMPIGFDAGTREVIYQLAQPPPPPPPSIT